MNELLVLVCLTVWLLPYLLGWDVFISTHEFLTFPFLILSVPLAGVSSCLGMSFCLGLNHKSWSQLCKAWAGVSAGLWNKLCGYNHHILSILREPLLPKTQSKLPGTAHLSFPTSGLWYIPLAAKCAVPATVSFSQIRRKKKPHVFWGDPTSSTDLRWRKSGVMNLS